MHGWHNGTETPTCSFQLRPISLSESSHIAKKAFDGHALRPHGPWRMEILDALPALRLRRHASAGMRRAGTWRAGVGARCMGGWYIGDVAGALDRYCTLSVSVSVFYF